MVLANIEVFIVPLTIILMTFFVSFSGELPIKLNVLTLMMERSFLGVEKMMIWLGKRAMSGDQYTRAESFRTVVGSTLLRVCCQSPVVFQVLRLVFAGYFSEVLFLF